MIVRLLDVRARGSMALRGVIKCVLIMAFVADVSDVLRLVKGWRGRVGGDRWMGEEDKLAAWEGRMGVGNDDGDDRGCSIPFCFVTIC